ncbi:glycosyltransferase family 4 protein [Conexibacter sp. JD483]|uniref:glycosyltransferase family 4 protein n=1 Tax=unclassified Conexibacter TaxID=2627773 RepID=UPI0027229619|nr:MULTISPECIES: glycosyltransferase family 4 protein [unclassified Conexibacter]MDO8185951.1 glycosyltransferase family 4 protein [Conexibacter sp. CPCC 205706]MDO8199442.1 glycosyltransferase family 4 protein [Conexibacter sp. CPCC 205762]MDR9368560.1 glycosyltransferase family 4 protein [Conexibacter sp. JD483]
MASTRILLLHNRYRAAGGEERVVDQLETVLRAHGHAVARLERDSSAAGAATAARGLLRGGLDEHEVADAVRAHRAEIVHAHNVHPLFGWRALAAARAAGARVVLHLHNYRLVCAIGVGFRDGAPCARCHGRDLRPGVRLRCRGGLPEALVYGAGLALQQPRLLQHADAVVAVSAAQLALLRDGYGVALPQARVLLNAVETIAEASLAGEGSYALAAGRLVDVKGFDVAVRAAVTAGVPLRVAGSGPEEERLRALAGGADVRFLGRLSQQELGRERRGAAVMLAPSRSDDPCPMSVVEALADGLPVLGGDRGGVPELVGPGATLPAEDAGAWSEALRALWEDPAARARAGAAALARARAEHAPEVFYERLISIYHEALAR